MCVSSSTRYNSCDWGTLPNQTNPDQTAPHQALHAEGQYSSQYENKLSFLPGQRASACTCPGEDHPGPTTNVGRSAPEIDIVEAQNADKVGEASQSLQTAPFDDAYNWTFSAAHFFNEAKRNTYTGAVFQEAISGTQTIPSDGYVDAEDSRFVTFGFEYKPDFEGKADGFITWYVDGKKSWTAPSAVVPPNPDMHLGQRLIPVEPMAIVINFGTFVVPTAPVSVAAASTPPSTESASVRETDAGDHVCGCNCVQVSRMDSKQFTLTKSSFQPKC